MSRTIFQLQRSVNQVDTDICGEPSEDSSWHLSTDTHAVADGRLPEAAEQLMETDREHTDAKSNISTQFEVNSPNIK